MDIAILGHMGRDVAAADSLAEHRLHFLGKWRNPGLVEKAEASGGSFQVIDSITNVELIADYVQDIAPDMFFTNFDDSLAAGVVDAIKRRVSNKRMPNLLIPCPDQATFRVESDKFYLRELIEEIDPKYNPVNFMALTKEAVDEALAFFKDINMEVALKPRHLTGGKGVKVQGKHFRNLSQARVLALQILADKNQEGLEVQEKLEGHEFTLQLFTDGKTIVKPPATYDYPYREDGDEGPGTGGMGSFTMPGGEQLPFITQEDYDEAVALMDKLLIKLKERGLDYKGVLYPTFFKTADGLKIVEVNARGGDPELVNILDLMEDNTNFGEVLKLIAIGELAEDSVQYKKLASAMLYLVSPDYAYRDKHTYDFSMIPDMAELYACKVRYAATEKISTNRYRTVGSSRSVGISSLGDKPWIARDNILEFIRGGFEHPLPLVFRAEVAEEAYIRNLAK